VFKKLYEEFKFFRNIRRERYDIVIDLDCGDRSAGITFISGAKVKVGRKGVKSKVVRNTYTDFMPAKNKRHTVEVGLDAARVLGVPIKNKIVEIFWSRLDENIVNINKDFIHIHPLSKAPYKEVDNKTIADIIDYCELGLGYRVVLTSAPIKREKDEICRILNLCKSNPVNLSGKLTLKQAAALNKKSKLFIGVDTALMHISAANNVRVFAFFGPTSPCTWGPWDNKSECSPCLRKNGVQVTEMHTVYSQNFPCIPCNNLGCSDSFVSQCLMSYNLTSIKKSIKNILNK
jgi:heptosyltransferase-3